MPPIHPLPDRPDGIPWPSNITAAYNIINNSCNRAETMIRQADMDPIRLRLQLEVLTSDVFPLLLVMENVAEREQIPQDWLLASALTTKGLVLALEAALENSEGRYGIHSDRIKISNHSCSLTIERL
jgi:hypothetical protein